MKKILILIFALLISSISFADQKVVDDSCITVNKYPRSNEVFLYKENPYTGCVRYFSPNGWYNKFYFKDGWMESDEYYNDKGILGSIHKYEKGKSISHTAYRDGKVSYESIYEYGDRVLSYEKNYYPNGNLRVEKVHEWTYNKNELFYGHLISKTNYYQDGSIVGQTPIKDFFLNIDILFAQNWLYIVIIAFFISLIFVRLLPKTAYTINTIILISCYYYITRNCYEYYIHPSTGHIFAFIWISVASFISVIPRLFMKIYSRDKWLQFLLIIFLIIFSFIMGFMTTLIISTLSVGMMLLLYTKNLQLINEGIINKKKRKKLSQK